MSDFVLNETIERKGTSSILAKIWQRYGFWIMRFAKAILIAFIVTTIIFFVIRLMPGSPLDVLVQELVVSRGYSQEEATQYAASLTGIDLNEPIGNQYLTFMQNLLKGDFGTSYRSRGVSVNSMIAARLPWTLFSVGLSLLLSFIIGIALGMIVAYKRNTWIDHLLTNIAAALDAIPSYLIGIVLFMLLGIIWKVVPIAYMRGSSSPGIEPGFTLEYIADILAHVAVPAIVYILATAGNWMLTMKSSTLSTLGEDYVTVARARGLSDSRIITSYVGRNASLPLATRLAISIAYLIGGSVLIESIFTYQGIGLLLSQALSGRDYPVMQAVFIVTTIAVIFANLLADFLYGWLDPRIRIVGGSK